jgi:hypothetical protein
VVAAPDSGAAPATEDVQPQEVQAQEVQAQEVQAQEVQAQDLLAQAQPEQVVAFAPSVVELPPEAAPSDSQPRASRRPIQAAAPPADDTPVGFVLPKDDGATRDPSPVAIDPAKIANLQAVLDALDRARARTPDPAPLAGPRPPVGPGGMVDTLVSRAASAVAGPVAPTSVPSSGKAGAARTNLAPRPRDPSAVPPAVQMLRLRVGQPESADKPPAESTSLRVRVAPEDQPRLMALEASHRLSTDVLSLGLLAAGVAVIAKT